MNYMLGVIGTLVIALIFTMMILNVRIQMRDSNYESMITLYMQEKIEIVKYFLRSDLQLLDNISSATDQYISYENNGKTYSLKLDDDTSTPKQGDYVLVKQLSNGNKENLIFGITQFEIDYYDIHMTEISSPNSSNIDQVRFINIYYVIESSEKISDDYVKAIGEERIYLKNL